MKLKIKRNDLLSFLFYKKNTKIKKNLIFFIK